MSFSREELIRFEARRQVFKQAGSTYKWPEELDKPMTEEFGETWMAWVLAAICSRESRFGLALSGAGLGDAGHGHGEMQIDNRSHADFCATNGWKSLEKSLEYVHKAVIVPSFNYLGDHGELFPGEGDSIDYVKLFWATIAAYNCGAGNVRKALEAGDDVDSRTTGNDYSLDVRNRVIDLQEQSA